MLHATNLILVDPDMKRRAAIAHMLSPQRIHVEPFETVDELALRWPKIGTILLHDNDNSIALLMRRMAHDNAWFPLIAFSESPPADRIVGATLAGALEYIAWPFTSSDLDRSVARAQRRAAAQENARTREAMARSRVSKLTTRERQVLQGVAGGLSNRLIGDKLSISPRTVEIHRANMLGKLGASHTSEAIRIAIEANLPN